MNIPIIIPYASGRKLCDAYNQSVERCTDDWIAFVDWDVLLGMNPYVGEAMQQAVAQVGHKAGFISFVTNRIGPRAQRSDHPELRRYAFGEDPDDIKLHLQIAADRWKKYKYSLTDVTDEPHPATPLSGFAFLTHKEAWKKVGGFPHGQDGFTQVDWDYCNAVRKAGYRWYVMKGIYMYHVYRYLKRDPKRKIPFVKP